MITGFSGCGKTDAPPAAAPTTTAAPTAVDPVQTVTRLLTGLGSNDPTVLSAIDAEHYIDHDLTIANTEPDRLAGLKDYLASIPAKSLKVTPLRVFKDGAVVVAQSSLESANPQAAFDVFLFDHGKIVEHWNNAQDRPADPNQSGHTMIDGPTDVIDSGDTDANKSVARKFVTDVLIGGKLDGFDSFFDGDKYIQHDPLGSDGASGLKAAITALGGPTGYSKVQRVQGRGNFVLVMSIGSLADKPTAFFDLFRLEKGKLAEHWATVQQIPARESWKNKNGKF